MKRGKSNPAQMNRNTFLKEEKKLCHHIAALKMNTKKAKDKEIASYVVRIQK